MGKNAHPTDQYRRQQRALEIKKVRAVHNGPLVCRTKRAASKQETSLQRRRIQR